MLWRQYIYAHQQSRKADYYLRSGKFEEAISCHQRAADLLDDALKQTSSDKARESLVLQRDFHFRQKAVVQYKQNQQDATKKAAENLKADVARLKTANEEEPPGEQHPLNSENIQLAIFRTMAENDSLLQFLIQPNVTTNSETVNSDCVMESKSYDSIIRGAIKTPKDDKTLIEELRVNNEELKKLVQQLIGKLEKASQENQNLRVTIEDLQRKIVGQGSRTLQLMADRNSPYQFSPISDSSPGGGLRELPALAPLEIPNFDFTLLRSEAARQSL
ncbi:nuclear receptor-binding factor 2-like isoform X1 [Limulus polyphemus]|uniref:Nuclear receptor-binding factor 2-like isoform X1 n=1 Tax=Limulus polyphemus TaxID=6850 RepID=A0ABM1SSK3_LIMPO|nr:nuclear receptor-binding factor 2-like isoform X1 [Limulus polyphemus]